MRYGALSHRAKARMFIKWTRLLVEVYGNARVADVIKKRGGV
jgi:hypothetical protein